MVEATQCTSAGTVVGTLDTLDADFACIDIIAGSADAAVTALTSLRMAESDTQSAFTAHTDGDAVTAFVGAAATSTSAGFVLPACSSTKQNVYRFNVDLRGRKRYLGVDITISKQTEGVGMIGHLYRNRIEPAQATAATTVDGARLIVSG
jgi:hypothetical protein